MDCFASGVNWQRAKRGYVIPTWAFCVGSGVLSQWRFSTLSLDVVVRVFENGRVSLTCKQRYD